jgi:asparagine synthase (glutamine-hydrolysing)
MRGPRDRRPDGETVVIVSGIVGVLRTDRAAVEPSLIESLTTSLTLRGPDARVTWCDGPVALGHTLLRTTCDREIDGPTGGPPFSLDGNAWIVADARVDACSQLASALDRHGEKTTGVSSASQLILRAYLRWGEACVEHLLGDFAFAIWDRRRRRLFCARDHMGIKPFYYAHLGPWLLVSNMLECLRGHPAVSTALNDLAIADFLLFGSNQDSATTAFRDIQRLPPAHSLTWSDAGLGLHRYWRLPIEEPVSYGRDRDYIDQFNDLAREAVSDRLRTDRVSIFMSGGVDSPALAAIASRLLRAETHAPAVRAFTLVYGSPNEDPDGYHAGLVARHLAIPIRYYVMDGRAAGGFAFATGTPEPMAPVTDGAPASRCRSEMAAHGRVAFFGEGPDNALLYEWRPYVSYLLRERRWARLVADAGNHLISHKRVPLLPTIPRMVRHAWTWPQHKPVFPPWMASEVVNRLQLRERWHTIHARSDAAHPVRPGAYASLLAPLWQSLFERLEPSYTGVALEVRHPFVDIRLLRFLLRVPVVPWCRDKYLFRQALRGVLPEAVRVRHKTPLDKNPSCDLVRRFGLPQAVPSPALSTYGDVRQLSQPRSARVAAVQADLRFVALSFWLRGLDSIRSIASGRPTLYTTPARHDEGTGAVTTVVSRT